MRSDVAGVTKPPPYLDRWELGGSPQPFIATGVHMEGFVFLVDSAPIDALLKRYLSHGGMTYGSGNANLRTIVLLAFSHISHVAAQKPPYSECCYGEEQELAIFVMAVRKGHVAPAFFTPYIFVDNPTAVAQGREIHGYPKEMGILEMRLEPRRERLAVQAHGVECFRRDSKLQWLPLLEVQRLAEGAPLVQWSSYDQAAQDLNAAVAERVPEAAAQPNTVWPPRGPAIFLKQFLAARADGTAAYQAVIGAEIVVPKFQGGIRWNERWRLRLHELDSHPLTRHLGLKDESEALLNYQMDFDFVLTEGKEIWSAPCSAGATEASPA